MKTNENKARVALTGLPGVCAQDTYAVCVRSVTAAVREIRLGNAITASGSNGAINVWKDDLGFWRCELHQWLVTKESGRFKHIAAVAQWLKDQWPRMKRG